MTDSNFLRDHLLKPAVTHLPTLGWLLEGWRAGFGLPPRTAGRTPEPLQFVCLVALFCCIEIGLGRLEVSGAASFGLQAWVSGWWSTLVFIGMGWWALQPKSVDTLQSDQSYQSNHSRLAALAALWLVSSLPAMMVAQLISAAIAQHWIPDAFLASTVLQWVVYIGILVWSQAVTFLLIRRFTGWTWRGLLFMLVMAACTALSLSQFNARTWQADSTNASGLEPPRLRLSQQAFEQQQELLIQKTQDLLPHRPGVTDVYGLVFAPYATEDVFKRETQLVSSVLAERFDADGRVLQLLNHASTVGTHVWATPVNLERAIQALAARMDVANDVLVVYLTSHGGSDFKLAASHWPLEVDPLTPQRLRAALDKSGIKNRVIAVSACYSGGWIEPLADEHSLIMTAADATHTSYGCGRLSELTYFGRALFDEQLRQTHSFEQAFSQAVPIIKQREIDAGKDDGFSNPQIAVGTRIKPLLLELEQRLNAMPPAPVKPAVEPVLKTAKNPPPS